MTDTDPAALGPQTASFSDPADADDATDGEGGTCWFCHREVAWLIAGYDTWDEQRLACRICNDAIRWLNDHGLTVSRVPQPEPQEPTPVPDATAGSVSVDAAFRDLLTNVEYLMEEHGTRVIDIEDLRAVVREQAALAGASDDRAEAPAPSMPPAVGLPLDVPTLERAYANTEGIVRERSRRGWGEPFWVTFAAEYARLAPAVAPVGDGLATGFLDAFDRWMAVPSRELDRADEEFITDVHALREDPDHAG